MTEISHVIFIWVLIALPVAAVAIALVRGSSKVSTTKLSKVMFRTGVVLGILAAMPITTGGILVMFSLAADLLPISHVVPTLR